MPEFHPNAALGDDNSYVDFTLTSGSGRCIDCWQTIQMPIEVLRTRGLVGHWTNWPRDEPRLRTHSRSTANAWMVVENLGNAQESTASIDWTAPSWGGSPSLHDAEWRRDHLP